MTCWLYASWYKKSMTFPLKLCSVIYREYYSPFEAYNQSKLANVLFSYELNRRLKEKNCPVTSNAVHPGIVNTDLFQGLPWFLRIPQDALAYVLFKVIFVTLTRSAKTCGWSCNTLSCYVLSSLAPLWQTQHWPVGIARVFVLLFTRARQQLFLRWSAWKGFLSSIAASVV